MDIRHRNRGIHVKTPYPFAPVTSRSSKKQDPVLLLRQTERVLDVSLGVKIKRFRFSDLDTVPYHPFKRVGALCLWSDGRLVRTGSVSPTISSLRSLGVTSLRVLPISDRFAMDLYKTRNGTSNIFDQETPTHPYGMGRIQECIRSNGQMSRFKFKPFTRVR